MIVGAASEAISDVLIETSLSHGILEVVPERMKRKHLVLLDADPFEEASEELRVGCEASIRLAALASGKQKIIRRCLSDGDKFVETQLDELGMHRHEPIGTGVLYGFPQAAVFGFCFDLFGDS